MMKSVTLLAILTLLAVAASASNFVSLGYSDQTVILDSNPYVCDHIYGVTHNHDGFESCYGWWYGGVVPPYYGAWGEGYDLGAGTVLCGVFWVSTLPGMYYGQSTDCYVWEGGVHGPPDAVLGVVTGIVFDHVPLWPTIGLNEVEMNVGVGHEFTVGLWGNWPNARYGYLIAVDLNGPGGYPWTCVAPGIGYPTGWNDPSILWGPTQSTGCGVVFRPTPPQTVPDGDTAPTWGSIKTLFKE